jgi:hypothetical protein
MIVEEALNNKGTAEQTMRVVESMKAVNLDEVTIEIIKVDVRYYTDEVVLNKAGKPLLDKKGEPRTYRKPDLRTAHIQNLVTIDDYEEAMAMSQQGMTEQEALRVMTNIVVRIWQRTEGWMERKDIIEGIDFDGIAGLFARFFDKMSRSELSKPRKTRIQRSLPV